MERALLLCNESGQNKGIGEHCSCLSRYLSDRGIETETISFNGKTNCKRVHIVKLVIDANNPFNWTLLANNEMKQKGRELNKEKEFDLIHVHDWTTATAGMALSKLSEKPLVLTLHSTEHNRGFCNQHSQIVSSIEWWASFEAKKVIVDNRDAYNSVKYDLNLPEEKIVIADPLKQGWQGKVLEEYGKVA